MLYFTLAILLFAQVCSGANKRLVDIETLKLVTILFRHGDRTPELNNIYSNSEFRDESHYMPYGYGQLTKEGMLNTYNLGLALRERYNGFLNEEYNIKLVEGRSSDFNRTKASLQLVLAGLFPPTNNLSWSNENRWLPIPYNYVVRENDKELFCFGCPNWNKNFDGYLESTEGKSLVAQHQSVFDIINKNTGENVTDLLTFYYYYFGLEIQDKLKFNLPEWTSEVYPNDLKKVVITYYSAMLATNPLKQMAGGYFLKKIMGDFEAKIKGILNPSERKMFLYSGHENNIASVLELLGVWNINDSSTRDLPPYNSYIAFELHEINNQYGLQVYYQDQSSIDPQLIVLPDCDEFCPFDSVKRQIIQYISMNDSVCGSTEATDSASMRLQSNIFKILFISSLTLLIFNL